MNWEPLKEGDIVDVVATSWPSTKKELQNGLRLLKSWGLKPRVTKNFQKKDFIFAQTDEFRAKDFYRALSDKKSKAVFCLRGGYGANRLIPFLKKYKKPKFVKPVLGLSDVTVLHVWLNQYWGWPTLHGPVLARLGNKEKPQSEKIEVKKILFGNLNEVSFKKLKPLNSAARKTKKINSIVVGGNLRTIEAGLETSWEFKPKGKILFFEDVHERGYSIDRILVHLKQAGYLEGVKAIVLGDFVGGIEKNGRSLEWAAISRFAQECKFPVLRGIKSGHGNLQRCVPFNSKAKLNIGRNSTLTVLTGCKL